VRDPDALEEGIEITVATRWPIYRDEEEVVGRSGLRIIAHFVFLLGGGEREEEFRLTSILSAEGRKIKVRGR